MYIYIYIYYIYNICIIYTQYVLERLISVTEHLRSEPRKSEFLIASTLLVMKAYNIYQNTTKMHDTKQSSAIKQILEAFFLAIKMCTGFTRYVSCEVHF